MSLDFSEPRREVRKTKRKQDGFEPLPYTKKFLEHTFLTHYCIQPQTQDHLCKLKEQNIRRRK